ncbi:MAG: SRPBCC domain-containing protein [Gemmatimonadetes bacterium]|nr:SRPBCC domain-containing protein [Gemmatimonadota bacterium]
MRRSLIALALFVSPVVAAAQAPTVTANGFSVTFAVPVSAPPAAVFDALSTKIPKWWNPAHTFSGSAANLSIDARPGGCFCETFPSGGGVEHLRVIYMRPPSALRFSGALGPMQGSGLAGALTFELKPADGGTRVELTYNVGGAIAMGFDKIAPMAQGMLMEQVTRLKAYVETGNPEPARK